MRIESRASGDERLRVSLFLVMCVAFAVWFAYDGLYRYPHKNLNWALQALPEKPAEPHINSMVCSAELAKVRPGMSRAELDALLGPPILHTELGRVYEGPEVTGIVRVREGKVVSAGIDPTRGDRKVENPNYLARPEKIAKIRPGMTEEEVAQELGKPTGTEDEKLWYVGPAAYASVRMADGKVVSPVGSDRNPTIRESTEPSESDIFWQKVIAMGLAFGSLLIAVKFIRLMRLSVVLDDSGLHYNGRHIPWDAMQELIVDQYSAKGWVDLVYQAGSARQKVRLDSYRISSFRPLLTELCQRKGFTIPPLSSDRPEQVS